jgi:hypothetical protein
MRVFLEGLKFSVVFYVTTDSAASPGAVRVVQLFTNTVKN